MTWRIRLMVLLELLTVLATGWDGLRDAVFPDGITGAQMLIVLILLVIVEELWRIRQHFKIDL